MCMKGCYTGLIEFLVATDFVLKGIGAEKYIIRLYARLLKLRPMANGRTCLSQLVANL